jgi:hypothetical protein
VAGWVVGLEEVEREEAEREAVGWVAAGWAEGWVGG